MSEDTVEGRQNKSPEAIAKNGKEEKPELPTASYSEAESETVQQKKKLKKLSELPPLQCKDHVHDEASQSFARYLFRLFKLNTCFCFQISVKGPKAGTKPETIQLRTPQVNGVVDEQVCVVSIFVASTQNYSYL